MIGLATRRKSWMAQEHVWRRWRIKTRGSLCVILLLICLINIIWHRSGQSCNVTQMSKIAGSIPTQALKCQRNKTFLPRSLVKIQYCGEPPWPRGSVLGLRPPGLEFRILCLEGSVVSFITPSSNVLLAHFSLYVHKGGLKTHSSYFICLSGNTLEAHCANANTSNCLYVK